jgi:diadenosine tetraphosphate (Ap4A) HIT family hydrolase
VTTARSPVEESCLVCREHTGEVALPGGHLLADDHVVAFHVPPLSGSSYLGHLLVTSRRHCPDFADLDPGEAASVGVAISACSAALKALGAGHVYVATVGHGVAHLHVHLLPRWPETPDDVAWYAVDDWSGARRGGEAEIVSIVTSLRRHLEP